MRREKGRTLQETTCSCPRRRCAVRSLVVKPGMHFVISSRLAATIAVVIGLAGAGLGAGGAVLFVERGPAGPQGPSGKQGAEGPQGADTFSLEAKVDRLSNRVSGLTGRVGRVGISGPLRGQWTPTDVGSAVDNLTSTTDDLDSRLSDIESRTQFLESDVSDVCRALHLVCFN
jgi:hypothetical protein